MPTILRILGYRFYFYALEDKEPPHAHIDKGSGTLKVWLDDLRVAHSEGLKPAEVRAALKLSCEHQKLLLQAWHELQNRKS